MPWQQDFWNETISEIQAGLTTWLPALLGALLLLVAGWLIARVSQAIVGRLLRRLGLDSLAERTGIARFLANMGVQSSLSFLLARIVYWLILIFFILLALGSLGLTDVVTAALNSFFAFLPRIIAATAIFLIGAFIARVVGDAVSAVTVQSNITSGRVLGQAVRYSLLLVTTILALDALGVQTTILTTIILVIVAAAAFGSALAFGLGNRSLAHSIMAGFHAREEFTRGQMLAVGEHRGRLLRIGATKTRLETSDGQISLPNALLLNEVVRLPVAEESNEKSGRTSADDTQDEAAQ